MYLVPADNLVGVYEVVDLLVIVLSNFHLPLFLTYTLYPLALSTLLHDNLMLSVFLVFTLTFDVLESTGLLITTSFNEVSLLPSASLYNLPHEHL